MVPGLRVALIGFVTVAGVWAGITAWCSSSAPSDPDTVLAVAPWRADALLNKLVQMGSERTVASTAPPVTAPGGNRATEGAAPEGAAPATAGPPPAPTIRPVGDGDMALARKLLAAAPMSEAPLVLAASAARAKPDQKRADVAYAAILKRDPRSVPARMWAIEGALRANDFAKTVAMLDELIVINPSRRDAYLDLIVGIARSPAGRKAIEEALATPRTWGEAAINRLNASSQDLAFLVRLNQHSDITQTMLVGRILGERGPAVGFLAWLDFVDPKVVDNLRWPYNADFRRDPAPPPFNWRLLSRQAEIAESGGLNVTYLGKGLEELADQIMMLGPGAYRFTAQMKGASRPQGGEIAWTIACYSKSELLGEVVAKLESNTPTPQTFTFTIPAAGCDAQKLTIIGRQGDFPLMARADTLNVRIDPAPPATAIVDEKGRQ